MGNAGAKDSNATPPPSSGNRGGGRNRNSQAAIGAITKLKEQQRTTEMRINNSEKKMANLQKEAKKILAAAKTPQQKAIAKRRALQKLKQKKMIEKQIEQSNNHLMATMKQIMTIEESLNAAEHVAGIKQGNLAMNRILHQMGGTEGAEKAMEDNEELTADIQDIQDIVAGGADLDLDEDELEAEFAELQQDSVEEDLSMPEAPLADTSPLTNLPVAPTSDPIRQSSEAELESLEALMA